MATKPERIQHRVQLHVVDAIVGTWCFSPDEIGAAWLILLEHYQNGREFEFWDNPRSCARLLGYSKATWRRRRRAVRDCYLALLQATALTVLYGRQPLSRELRATVYARDLGICQYCRTPVAVDNFHCDHVVPVSRGGSDDIDNLACACGPCNLSKAARTVSEWSGRP